MNDANFANDTTTTAATTLHSTLAIGNHLEHEGNFTEIGAEDTTTATSSFGGINSSSLLLTTIHNSQHNPHHFDSSNVHEDDEDDGKLLHMIICILIMMKYLQWPLITIKDVPNVEYFLLQMS